MVARRNSFLSGMFLTTMSNVLLLRDPMVIRSFPYPKKVKAALLMWRLSSLLPCVEGMERCWVVTARLSLRPA